MRAFYFCRKLLLALGATLFAGCSSTPDTLSAPAARAAPRNAYVLLSGGGTPLTNNYSQYLQARAIADFFAREIPPERAWVFFGVGNREDAAPILSDTRRQLKHEGVVVESWLPGALKNNRPATRESILRALREEILPVVSDGGTLFLFVGDHGEARGKDDQRESVITLWEMKRQRRSGDWFTDAKEALGVAELRKILDEGLGRGRVVFCMTQCHSGGFHELGVAREPRPLRDWFTGVPPWLAANPPRLATAGRVAGFTATDLESPAAGCDPDPDPERWAGYERFFPEKLFGVDLMDGSRAGGAVAATSFAAAHEAATLVDATIDKPRATSEHFLATWAELIETRLTNTLDVSARTMEAVAAYQRAVDTGRIASNDPEIRARAARFARFTQRLGEQAPSAAELLRTGTRPQLEQALATRAERRGGRGGGRSGMAEARRAWRDTLRPAWKAAVLRGGVAGLSGAALAFEKRLLEVEDEGTELLLPRGGDDTDLLNEVYWESSYAEPATFDAAKASAVTHWAAIRRARIIGWAAQSADEAVRAAAEKIGPGPAFAEEPVRPMSRRTAIERALFYRRVLAAWEFLLTMQAAEPLAELRQLIALEQFPVRGQTERLSRHDAFPGGARCPQRASCERRSSNALGTTRSTF